MIRIWISIGVLSIAASTTGMALGQYSDFRSSAFATPQQERTAAIDIENVTPSPFASMRTQPDRIAERSQDARATYSYYQTQTYTDDGSTIVNPAPGHSFYDQPTQTYESLEDEYFESGDVVVKSFGPPVRNGWYAGVGGLLMSRNRENKVWLSYDQADIRDRVLTTRDAEFSYAGGVETTIGHYFNNGRNSIAFSYWGIFPGTSEANAYGADTVAGLDTILHFDDLQYNAGAGNQDLSGTFFFGAERHRLRRSYDVSNVEINLLGHNFGNGCGPLQLGWTAGIRYMRFNEGFLYSSDVVDTTFTGAAEEVHYGIDVENNLYGFQLGGRGDYCMWGGRLKLFANTKVGVFGNSIDHRSRIYGSTGSAFVNPGSTSPYAGQDIDITSNKTDVSFISELSLGATWCLSPRWKVNAGYRAIGISGLALATNQVPGDFIAALDSARWVDSNAGVILHGAFFGAEYSR